MLLHGGAVSSSETAEFHQVSLVGEHLGSAKHRVASMVWHIVTCASYREPLWMMHFTLLVLIKLVSHVHVLQVSGTRTPHEALRHAPSSKVVTDLVRGHSVGKWPVSCPRHLLLAC